METMRNSSFAYQTGKDQNVIPRFCKTEKFESVVGYINYHKQYGGKLGNIYKNINCAYHLS